MTPIKITATDAAPVLIHRAGANGCKLHLKNGSQTVALGTVSVTAAGGFPVTANDARIIEMSPYEELWGITTTASTSSVMQGLATCE